MFGFGGNKETNEVKNVAEGGATPNPAIASSAQAKPTVDPATFYANQQKLNAELIDARNTPEYAEWLRYAVRQGQPLNDTAKWILEANPENPELAKQLEAQNAERWANNQRRITKGASDRMFKLAVDLGMWTAEIRAA